MITAYYGPTGNSMRVILMLEECGLAYRRKKIDLAAKENRSPEVLQLNPLGFIPILVDEDGPGGRLVLTQSGAILSYLAEKSGKLIPKNRSQQLRASELLFSVVSDINPMNRVLKYLDGSVEPFAVKMRGDFEAIQKSVFKDMQRELGDKEFILDEFSLVDVALYSITRIKQPMLEADPAFAKLMGWFSRMSARPAVLRAYSD